MLRATFLALALPTLALACSSPEGSPGGPRAVVPNDEGVAALLRGVPGLEIVAEEEALAGTARFYRLTFAQPTDHARPNEGLFRQRVTILQRNRDAPTVLYSGGYYVSQSAREAELTNLLQANQISVEHRYFKPSRPEPPAWEHLTLAQAAADHHRLVEALRPIFTGKWISTGGSKGGLTALFHRRFFPGDVDATVAYVAPILDGLADARFPPFFERVGDVACRDRLRKFQRAALGRREEVGVAMSSWAKANDHAFVRLGQDRAYEFAVLELPFFLWQYQGAQACEGVPADDAPAAKVFEYVDRIVNVADNYVDANIDAYAAYWQQSQTELGAPAFPEAHLQGLLRYPGEDTPATFAPVGVPGTYRPEPTRDVARWITGEAERLLLLYGENDPWSAGAVELGPSPRDSTRYTLPGGNHQSRLSELPEGDRAGAYATLARWSGRTVVGSQTQALSLLPIVHPKRDGGAEPWHLRVR